MLGQPVEVLHPCQMFAIANILSLPGFWFSACVGTTLVSMTISTPVVICDVLGALLNMSMTFVFLRFGHTGYIGAAYANVMAAWFTAGFMYFYVKFSGKEHIVWKLAPQAADGPPPISLKQYLAIAIPSAFSLWAEWWANQVLAIFAGWLPAGEMAVGGNGIIANFLVGRWRWAATASSPTSSGSST